VWPRGHNTDSGTGDKEHTRGKVERLRTAAANHGYTVWGEEHTIRTNLPTVPASPPPDQ